MDAALRMAQPNCQNLPDKFPKTLAFLQQMEDKGYITTYRKGHFAYVHALMPEEDFQKEHAREETDFWFRGKASAFLAALYESGGLPAEDAGKIRRLLDEWNY